MIKLENELINSKYTKIFHEKEYKIAPSNFLIEKYSCVDCDKLTSAIINFQDGQIKDGNINGVFDEDLIAVIIKRLECMQNSKYKCSENAFALIKLEEAFMALKTKSSETKIRGVLNTHNI